MTAHPTADQNADTVADAVFGAIERGDMEALSTLWADDIEVWHSNDGVVQDKAQNLAVLGWMIKQTETIEYRDIIRDLTAAGFAQRHVLALTFDGGRTADLPVAIFVTVRDGQVTRIDEYVDSAHVAAAFSG
ncbi:nuclear transport factor 2 family protein [Ilumatobacter nonamiensis]|uniref:nuclear transport factor 2 family protein n=1 Tax=Ilumatobacter nonamiensis TaxID=467093 RepID=UPI0003463AD1|nr:nuclear transport factor 2 family protein [Ilumatobacter nonamiensis]